MGSFIDSRRNFLKNSFIGASALIMSGCEFFDSATMLKTLSIVQNDLFPFANTLDSNAHAYLSVILNHSRISDAQKATIADGVKLLNIESIKEHKQLYINLSSEQREIVLKEISKERWGENWIEAILTYTMEAVLGDPIYGINKKEAGWKWLNHDSGLPRPKEAYL